MSQTDSQESFRYTGDSEFYWLSESFYLRRLLRRRLIGLKKYLAQRGISSVQTQINSHFCDTVCGAERVLAKRLEQKTAMHFWGLRHNRYISEVTGGAVLSLWRRAHLAAKHDAGLLAIWARDGANQAWPLLCAAISEMRNCPQLLGKFARHSSTSVKLAVVDNLYTDLATMFALATDEDLDVRYAIAENHNAPIAVLQKLLSDINPYVVDRAQRTLARLMNGDVRSGQFGKHYADKRRRVMS